MLFALWVALAFAQTPETPIDTPPLVVAIKPSPPFTMVDESGHWQGISIELWEAVAKETNRPFVLKQLTLSEMLEGLEAGTVDVGVAALTVTADREAAFDFTQPFFQGGLGIAVNKTPRSPLALVWRVLSARFLQTIAGLVAVVFFSGFVIYLFERKNTDPRGINSVFDAFWWSAVTMTTVGYGDRIPQTPIGRIIAMVWMFSGIVLISSFTATISSVLTVSQLENEIDGPEDLTGVRVGTVEASTSASWTQDHRVYAELYDNPTAALQALVDGEVEAVIYDAAVLQYMTNNRYDHKLTVLPRVFARQNYAIGLRSGLEGREALNHALLTRIESPWYRELTFRYLGTD